MRRSGARIQQLFEALFSGALFGAFDREIDSRADRLSVDRSLTLKLRARRAVDRTKELERDLTMLPLSPIDKLAFIVPFLIGHSVDIDKEAEDTSGDDIIGDAVAAVEIDSADESLDGIATHRLKDAMLRAVIVDKVDEADTVRESVKANARDDFGAENGEEALVVMRIAFIEIIGHNSAKDSVAEVLETFVVERPSMSISMCGRLMSKSHLIEMDVVRAEAENVFKEEGDIGRMVRQKGAVMEKGRDAKHRHQPMNLRKARLTL